MLFCLRGLYDRALHADRFLKPAFWSLNIGLAMMVFMSLLPAGIYQAWASISKGLWFARSAEFVHSPLMEAFVWLRVPGDIVFAAGSVMAPAPAEAFGGRYEQGWGPPRHGWRPPPPVFHGYWGRRRWHHHERTRRHWLHRWPGPGGRLAGGRQCGRIAGTGAGHCRHGVRQHPAGITVY
jgi:hypothetical protein